VDIVERIFSIYNPRTLPQMFPIKSKIFCLLLIALSTLQQRVASEDDEFCKSQERVELQSKSIFSPTVGVLSIHALYRSEEILRPMEPLLFTVDNTGNKQKFCLIPTEVMPETNPPQGNVIIQYVTIDTHEPNVFEPTYANFSCQCCPSNGYREVGSTTCKFLVEFSKEIEVEFYGTVRKMRLLERIHQEFSKSTDAETLELTAEEANTYVAQGLLKVTNTGTLDKQPRVVLIDNEVGKLFGADLRQPDQEDTAPNDPAPEEPAQEDEDQKMVVLIALAVLAAIFGLGFLFTLLYFIFGRGDK
jgi:hypothetical protein